MPHGFKAFNEFGSVQIDETSENMVVIAKFTAVSGVNTTFGYDSAANPSSDHWTHNFTNMQNFQVWAKPVDNRNCTVYGYIQRGKQLGYGGNIDTTIGSFPSRPGQIGVTIWATGAEYNEHNQSISGYTDREDFFEMHSDMNNFAWQTWEGGPSDDPFDPSKKNWYDFGNSSFSHWNDYGPWSLIKARNPILRDVLFDVVVVAPPVHLDSAWGTPTPFDYSNGPLNGPPPELNFEVYRPPVDYRTGMGINIFKADSSIAFSSHFQHMSIFNGTDVFFKEDEYNQFLNGPGMPIMHRRNNGNEIYAKEEPDFDGPVPRASGTSLNDLHNSRNADIGGTGYWEYDTSKQQESTPLPIRNYSLPKDTYVLINSTYPHHLMARFWVWFYGPAYCFNYGGTDVQIDIDYIHQMTRRSDFYSMQYHWYFGACAPDQVRTFMFGRLLA